MIIIYAKSIRSRAYTRVYVLYIHDILRDRYFLWVQEIFRRRVSN